MCFPPYIQIKHKPRMLSIASAPSGDYPSHPLRRRVIMSTRIHRIIRISVAALAIGIAGTAIPALAVKQTGGEYNTLYAGLGAKGYDVVSYFTVGKPVPGSDRFVAEYGGVKWQFSSADN